MSVPARPTHRDDLITLVEKERIKTARLFSDTHEMKQIATIMLSAMEKGEWFDFGTVDVRALLKAVGESKDIMSARLAIPPYDECVFRFRIELGDAPVAVADTLRKMGMVTREKVLLITRDGGIDAMSCIGLDVSHEDAIVERAFIDTKEGVALFGDQRRVTLGLDDTPADQSLYVLYGALWVVLNTKNIDLRVVEPSVKLNKARTKRGKRPLQRITYVNTVQYMEASKETDAMGSRASPRMHLRRAHLRRLPNGNQIVIHAMIINAHKKDAIEREHYRVQTPRPEPRP